MSKLRITKDEAGYWLLVEGRFRAQILLEVSGPIVLAALEEAVSEAEPEVPNDAK
jgi:hypothetical protein